MLFWCSCAFNSAQWARKNMPVGWRDGLVVEKYLLLFLRAWAWFLKLMLNSSQPCGNLGPCYSLWGNLYSHTQTHMLIIKKHEVNPLLIKAKMPLLFHSFLPSKLIISDFWLFKTTTTCIYSMLAYAGGLFLLYRKSFTVITMAMIVSRTILYGTNVVFRYLLSHLIESRK